jgi:XRE family transcriptional regulator, fatty acid utilization regulator
MHGRILRQLRESKGRSQAEVARSAGISPAQLARLESNQRRLYVDDFVRIAKVLGEEPGNLLPNDLGNIGHLKPLIDRLAVIQPQLLAHVAAIVDSIARLTEEAVNVRQPPATSEPSGARRSQRRT